MIINDNMTGILFGENYYHHGSPRAGIGRATGIHRIATLMRKRDVKVEVVDFFNAWNDDELIQFLNKFPKIDFVGFGLNLSPLISDKVDLVINTVKEMNPSVKVIAGGSGISDFPINGVDLYIKGFAEGAIDDILKFISTGKFNPFAIETTKTIGDTKKVVDCMKHYPKYDYTTLSNEYTDNDFIQPNEALAIEIGRGCIFKCKFCSFPLVGKNKNDYIREKEDIKRDLITNYTKWGTTRYAITDDTFNDNQLKVDMLYEISKEIDFKLDLVMYARIDLLRAFPGSVDKLVEAGVKGMFFGIESFNEKSSKAVGKSIGGDKLKEYLIYLRDNYPQLHLTCSFIVGLPHETIETFNSGIEWAIKENVVGAWTFAPLGIVIDNGVTGLAPLTYEWKDHGYVQMTQEDYDKKLNDAESAAVDKNDPFYLPTLLKRNRIDKFVSKDGNTAQSDYRLIWKNEHMDFLDAVVLSERSFARVHPYSTVTCFNATAQYFNRDIFDLATGEKIKDINWPKQINDVLDFLNNYKRKKLAI